MRDRVFAAVRALGYEPNILGQNLRRGSTRTIGLLVPDISNPLFSEFALGAEGRLNEEGYALLIANSHGISDNDETNLKLLRQRVDGLLLAVSDETDKTTLARLNSLDRPFVLLDRDIPGLDRPSVRWDHASGVRAVAKYLMDLGHRRIAMIDGNPHVRPTRIRSEALLSACSDRPGVRIEIHCGTFTPEHGEVTTDRLRGEKDPPTAIIAGSSQILVGVLRAIRRANLRIPAEISLVSIERAPMLEFIDPPIANIDRDFLHFGRVATEVLLHLVDGDPADEVVLPVSFDPGASCARPSDRLVRS